MRDLRQIVMWIEYDGSRFHGFQFQLGVPTVQGALEEALRGFMGSDFKFLAAGRTDTGVHALGQVVSVRTRCPISLDLMEGSLNRRLWPNVRIRKLECRSLDFHPRYSATLRFYRYVLCPDPELRSPMTGHYVTYVERDLDLAALMEASRKLIGSHNFISFTTCPSQEKKPTRSVDAILLERQGPYVFLDFYARSFLRGMVRNIVAWLLEVGRGRRDPGALDEFLDGPWRPSSIKPAPASGLYLMKIYYPGDPLPSFKDESRST